MTTDMSIMRLVLDASIPVQLVLLLLVAASLISWSIIFTKRRLVGRRSEYPVPERIAAGRRQPWYGEHFRGRVS